MGSLDNAGLTRTSHDGFCALRLCLVVGLILMVSGCGLKQWVHNGFKVGPNYCPPPAAVANNWIDSDDARVISSPPDYPDWWSVFQDPLLNDLVKTAYQQNLTLREAGLRVLEARMQRAIVAGNLLPQTQQINGSYAREQISTVQQPLLAPIPGLFSRSFDDWSLAGNLSWELDVWGRFRRAVEAADANLDASVHEYDAVLVCLIAEVATAYVDIRTFEQRLKYARQNVKIQEGSLKLAETRARLGKTDDISVHLAKSNLEDTKASIQPLEIGLRQANNRLCTLLGMPPIDLRYTVGEGGIPDAPAEVAVGIPADLLRRRPDVRAAESLVAEQSALIGVATSNLYPSIAITGKISVQAEEFGDLFTPLSQGGSIGPSFEWNILNYGRILNNVRLQDARFEELVVSYQNTVLKAGREVEDALVAFLRSQERVKRLAGTARETQRALELEMIRFTQGETDFMGVFVLQGALVQKQDQLADAQGDVITNLITIYKALGGGWQIRCPGFVPHGVVSQPPETMEVVPAPEALPPVPTSDIRLLPDIGPEDLSTTPISVDATSPELIQDEGA
jgi:NodT family efflux transporter outer membrane factor (OMF) lipoprotein